MAYAPIAPRKIGKKIFAISCMAKRQELFCRKSELYGSYSPAQLAGEYEQR